MLDERLGAIERVAELDAQLATATERVKHLDRELESTCEALREIRVQLDRAGAQASAATAALAVARAAPARHVSSIELMNELARRTTRRLGVR
jgi:chromosome segregation ATPase